MKRGCIAAAAAVLFATGCVAQNAERVAAEPTWLNSYDAALAEAVRTGKPILANFTEGASNPWGGPWSYRLHHGIFDQKKFKEWAAQNVVLLEVYLPFMKPQDEAEKKANAALAEKYRVEDLPAVIFLDANGGKIAVTGYERGGVEVFIEDARMILDAKKRTGI